MIKTLEYLDQILLSQQRPKKQWFNLLMSLKPVHSMQRYTHNSSGSQQVGRNSLTGCGHTLFWVAKAYIIVISYQNLDLKKSEQKWPIVQWGTENVLKVRLGQNVPPHFLLSLLLSFFLSILSDTQNKQTHNNTITLILPPPIPW